MKRTDRFNLQYELNRKGSVLLKVLVLSGIFSVVILILLGSVSNMKKSEKNNLTMSDADSLIAASRLILNQKNICTLNIPEFGLLDIEKTQALSYLKNLSKVEFSSGKILFSLNQPTFLDARFIVDKMRISNIKSVIEDKAYTAELELSLKSSNNYFRRVIPMLFIAKIDGTKLSFYECTSTSVYWNPSQHAETFCTKYLKGVYNPLENPVCKIN